MAPPGGESSFSISEWGSGASTSAPPIRQGGKRINRRAQTGVAIVGGGPTGGGIGRGTAHLFPALQLPERKHEMIGYQKPEIAGSRWETTNIGGGNRERRTGVGAAGASIVGAGKVTSYAGIRSSKPYRNRDSGRINQVLGSARASPRLRHTDIKVTSSHDHSSGAIPGGGVSGGHIPGGGVSDDWSTSNCMPGSAMSPYIPPLARSEISLPEGMAGVPTRRSDFGAAGAINWDHKVAPIPQAATTAQTGTNFGYHPHQQQQQQQDSQNQQQIQYQRQYQNQQQGTISSNVYSNGTNQNSGNVMTGRSTTRRLAPPGGFSSFSLG